MEFWNNKRDIPGPSNLNLGRVSLHLHPKILVPLTSDIIGDNKKLAGIHVKATKKKVIHVDIAKLKTLTP